MFNKLFSKGELRTERPPRPFGFRDWLTKAHPSIQDPGEQRAAILAASFLLVIIIFTFIGGFARAARMGLIAGFSGPIGISLIPLLLAYGLVKTKWYQAGIFTFALGFSSLAYVSMILEGKDANFGNLIFIYVPLSLIVVSALVSAWATFLLLGLNVGAFWITTSFVISYQPDGLVVLIGLMTTTGLVLIVLSNFQKNLERSRLDELKQINKELDSARIDLEQRVVARTKDLATVATISTKTAAIRDPFQMLATMVHLTQRGFNLYHAHVFTFHKDSDNLKILACGYREGDEHEGTHGTASIPISQEQSLVARAARTRVPVIVNDVRSDPGWLPNPLLPETRAELAVPMIVGDELLGVLDVQADHVDAFTEQDANIQMTLASQIATSYQSALDYEQSKTQAELDAMVNLIGQKIQRASTVEETLQTAIRELGTALGAPRVRASIDGHQGGSNRAIQESVK